MPGDKCFSSVSSLTSCLLTLSSGVTANGSMWSWTTASPPATTSRRSPNLSERTSSGALFWKKLMPSKHSLLISTAKLIHSVELRFPDVPRPEKRLTFSLIQSPAWAHEIISGVLNSNSPVLINVFILITDSNEKQGTLLIWHQDNVT